MRPPQNSVIEEGPSLMTPPQTQDYCKNLQMKDVSSGLSTYPGKISRSDPSLHFWPLQFCPHARVTCNLGSNPYLSIINILGIEMILPVNRVDPARGLRAVGVRASPPGAGKPTKGRKVLPGRVNPPKAGKPVKNIPVCYRAGLPMKPLSHL